ncbi:MAG: MMPL family transporter [candidate division Zixibacteria bacterium]|nr:MMPL family transporter [candidate division Zixibacteria bacterium]
MKEGLINFSTKHPLMVIGIIVILTGVFAFQLTGMQIDTDPENMLPVDEPVRIFHSQTKEEFGMHDFLAVGVVRENGAFNADQLQRIYRITEEITEIEGVIADDIMAPSLVDDIRQGGGNTLIIAPLMEEAPETDEEAQYILGRINDNPVLKGKLASEDGKALALFIPIESKDMSHRIAGEIKAITDKYGDGGEYFIAGLPVAQDSFGKEMFGQMVFSAPMAGLIIFLLMFMFFKNIRIILPPMIVAITSIIWTMGALVWAGYPVHIMSSMIPIFLFPIAVLNSIHIISEFHDKYKKYKHKETTIRHTINELFKPMLFTSATTVVGFLSLLTNNIPPVQVFGGFVAFGIAIAWLMSITLNPAFAMLMPDKALRNFGASDDKDTFFSRFVKGLGNLASKKYRIILFSATVMVIVSSIGLSMIIVNDNPVKWFKSDHPLRVADRTLNQHLDGTYMNYLIFDGGEDDAIKNPELLNYIENLQKYLEKNEIVGSTAGITDIVKKVRFELFGGTDKEKYSIPQDVIEVGQILFVYEMSGGDPDDLFKMVTDDYSKANLWVQMTNGDNQAVASVIADAEQYIQDNPPPSNVDINWAGLPYINVIWQDKMVTGMGFSLLISFIIVFIMMAFLFRSALWGLISMLPLTITIMAIYASIGYLGKPYDMPIAILSSLTLGLSIDFAIHFIQRSRTIHERTGNFRETYNEIFEGPGRAISRNVMVIAIGFVPMFFSNLVPYITVGTFFFAIMTVSGAVTLLLLPSLMIVLKKKLFPDAKI